MNSITKEQQRPDAAIAPGLDLRPRAGRAETPAELRPAEGKRQTVGTVTVENPVFSCRDVDVFYAEKHAIRNVTIDIGRGQVLAMIGPSGCGKSTFLRCLNRMNDTIAGTRVDGKIQLNGKNIYDPDMDVVTLRARVGMVFQKPNPFPKSIFENVAYGPRIHGLARDKTELQEIVVKGLE